MSVPPANTSLNLTPHAHQRCCDLFTCCLPTKGESEEDETEETNDRDLGLNPPDIPLVSDEQDTAASLGDDHGDSAAAGSGEDSEKMKKVLVRQNAQMNNNVLVAFLQALLSLLLFNFHNNRDNASGRAIQTANVSEKDGDDAVEGTDVGDADADEDDDDAVEETHVNILQTGEDEFEIEEIPFIRSEE